MECGCLHSGVIENGCHTALSSYAVYLYLYITCVGTHTGWPSGSVFSWGTLQQPVLDSYMCTPVNVIVTKSSNYWRWPFALTTTGGWEKNLKKLNSSAISCCVQCWPFVYFLRLNFKIVVLGKIYFCSKRKNARNPKNSPKEMTRLHDWRTVTGVTRFVDCINSTIGLNNMRLNNPGFASIHLQIQVKHLNL